MKGIYNMNYKKNKKRKLIITFLLIFILILVSLIFKSESSLSLLEIISKDVSNTVISIINKPIRVIQDKISKQKEKEKIFNTYELLSANEESIKLVLAQNENLKKEVDELKSLNNIKDESDDYDILSASVVKRNIGYWDNIITINKGISSGVKDNMAVITDKGLVGITTNVSNYYSDVKLLTTQTIQPKISVQVKTDNRYVPGILYKYNKDKKTFTVEGISEYKSIENGTYVYTTSYNENIPSGILVGQVIEVKKDSYDLAKIVEVKSEVDFDNLRYVDVLVKESSND